MAKQWIMFGILLSVAVNTYALRLSSPAFNAFQSIPVEYTCEGSDSSPALSWTNIPAGTRSYVLMLDDPDAPGGLWNHWIVFNLPAATIDLSENLQTLPSGAQIGTNSWGRQVYNGPCPPTGKHRYVFTLYALDSFLTIPAGSSRKQVLDALDPVLLAKATLVGVFTKGAKGDAR